MLSLEYLEMEAGKACTPAHETLNPKPQILGPSPRLCLSARPRETCKSASCAPRLRALQRAATSLTQRNNQEIYTKRSTHKELYKELQPDVLCEALAQSAPEVTSDAGSSRLVSVCVCVCVLALYGSQGL